MTKNPPSDLKATAIAAKVATIAGIVETAMLDPAEIAPSPTNPRKTFPEDSLDELGASMATDGQVQAILVRPITADVRLKWNKDHPKASDEERLRLRFEIVSGERRWRAAARKGLQLRAEIRQLTDLQVVRIQIIENLHREEVHPLEEAEGYAYLLKHSGEKVSVEQIADEVGKSKSYVLKRMKLAALCEDARKKFLAGEFDASTALLIARIPTPALQLQAIQEIADIGGGDDDYRPSYREIRTHLARRFHLKLATAPFDTTLQDLLPNCGACASCPKRTGNQSGLFEDVEDDDTCTDPDCFDGKRKAHVARVIAKARDDGIEVVEGKEAESIRPHYWGPVQGHSALNAVAYEEEDGTQVTYEQLLQKGGKKAPKPILFLDPHNKDAPPQMLVSDRAIEPLLKKFAPIVSKVDTPAAAKAFDDTFGKARRAEVVESKLASLAKEELRKRAGAERTAADLLLIVFALINSDWTTGLLEELGIEEPDNESSRDFDYEGAVLEALRTKSGAELGGIALRLACGDLEIWNDVPARAVALAAESHGINLAKLRKQAEKAVDADEPEDD